MPDQVTTIGLDDGAYQKGLDRVEGRSRSVLGRVDAAGGRAGASMAGKIGAGALTAGKAMTKFGATVSTVFSIAASSISAYGDKFPGVLDKSQDLEGAVKGISVELGRNYVASGMAGTLKSMADWASSALGDVIDLGSRLTGGGGMDEAKAALKDIEDAEARKRLSGIVGGFDDSDSAKARRQLEKDQAAITEAGAGLAANDPALVAARRAALNRSRTSEADRRAKASDSFADARSEIDAGADGLGGKLEGERSRLAKQIRGFEAMRGEVDDVAVDEAIRAARAASVENTRKIAKDFVRDKAGPKAEIEFDAKARQIQALELSGQERLAELEKVRLDFARQRFAISQNEALSDADKARAIAGLNRDEEDLVTLTGDAFDRDKLAKKKRGEARTLEAGFGAQAAQIFGGTGGRDSSKEQLRETRLQTNILKNIERNTKTVGGYAE